MRMKLAALAIVLATVVAESPAAAAYRLCIRAGGFDSRHQATVTVSVGGTNFVAVNGSYTSPGYAPADTCFADVVAFGTAMVGWGTPYRPCVGGPVPEGNSGEVWFIVDAVAADPGLGGLQPTCKRQ